MQRYRANRQAEIDSATLYEAIADAERTPALAEVYRRLAATERVHAGFEAVGRIRRKDYGLDFGYADAIVGDVISIELDLQFIGPQT